MKATNKQTQKRVMLNKLITDDCIKYIYYRAATVNDSLSHKKKQKIKDCKSINIPIVNTKIRFIKSD